jgi:outer membrane receptor for ferrienterochelin and colicin
VARADDLADEAELRFRLGTQSYQQGDYVAALQHFLVSNRLVPNVVVEFNLARTYEQLAEYPTAWQRYSAVLERQRDPALERHVRESLERIAKHVSVLDVETEPPGATLYVDRKDLGPRGEAPRSLGLPAGTYVVWAELPGHEPARTEPLTLTLGERRRVVIALAKVRGTLRILDAEGAFVRVAGGPERRLQARVEELVVVAGRQKLWLSRPGFRDSELEVDVPARGTLEVRPALVRATGQLRVTTDTEGSLVEVDGVPRGVSPVALTLPVGRYRVRASRPGFRPVDGEATVSEGGSATLALSLAREAEVAAVSRGAERVEDAPSSVTIITREELLGMGYPNLAEAVRGVRGMYLTDDRNYTTLGVRGAARPGDYGNKILILYDGHPFNDNILYQSFPGFEGRTDLADVVRIEIVRGPFSSYGTGAVLGVINVVTYDRSERDRVEVGASTAEYALSRGRVMAYKHLTPEMGIWSSASAGYGLGRDYYFAEYRDEPAALGGHARNLDGVKLGTLQGRYWWRGFELQWLWTAREKTLPTAQWEAEFGADDNLSLDERGFLEARYRAPLSAAVESMTRVHGNLYVFEATTPYAPEDGGIAREKFVGQWVGVEQSLLLRPTRGSNLSLGVEGQRHFRAAMRGWDNAGDYLPEEKNAYWASALYALGDAALSPAVRVHLGARFDAFRWSLSERTLVRTAWNPRAAVVLKPYEAGVLKLMGGSAFRAPSVYELGYQSSVQAMSPQLSPERILSAELEHTHRFSTDVSATASAFCNRIADLVVGRGAGTEADPWRFENSAEPILTVGSEAVLRRDWRSGFMAATQYSFQRSWYPASADELRKVSNSPQHMASFKGAVPLAGRQLRAMTRLTFESGREDRNETASDPPQRRTDASVIWDLVLSGQLTRPNLRYACGLYNAADYRYSVPVSGEFRMTTVPQPGRTLLLSVDVAF